MQIPRIDGKVYRQRLRQNTADATDVQWGEIHDVDYSTLSKVEIDFYLNLCRLPNEKRPKAASILVLEGYNKDIARKAAEYSILFQEGIPLDIGKMKAPLVVSIIRFSSGCADDPAMLEMAGDWHSYARLQLKNHFEMDDTITRDPIPITKFNTSARTDKSWLLDLDSVLPQQFEYVSPDSHVLLMIRGRDGLWTKSKPWVDFYARCTTNNVSV